MRSLDIGGRVLVVSAILLGGCDGAKFLTPPDLGPTKEDVKQAQLSLADLNQATFDLHKGLGMLSYGSSVTYGCGDPKDPIVRFYDNRKMGSEKLKEEVSRRVRDEDEQQSRAVLGSLEFLESYVKSLDEISKKGKANDETITSIQKGLGDAGDAIGGLYGASVSLAGELFRGAAMLNISSTNGRIRHAAQGANEWVSQAISYILEHQGVLLRGQYRAFRRWDACSREAIYYLRDAPTWDMSRTLRFKASTGAELFTLWQAYTSKRDAFTSRMLSSKALKEHLEKLQKDQRALLTDGKISGDVLKGVGEALGKAAKSAKSALDAAKKKDGSGDDDKDDEKTES